MGAYSPSAGLPVARHSVAEYLSARDGVPASADDVLLGSGASDLIRSVLALVAQPVDEKPPGKI